MWNGSTFEINSIILCFIYHRDQECSFLFYAKENIQIKNIGTKNLSNLPAKYSFNIFKMAFAQIICNSVTFLSFAVLITLKKFCAGNWQSHKNDQNQPKQCRYESNET